MPILAALCHCEHIPWHQSRTRHENELLAHLSEEERESSSCPYKERVWLDKGETCHDRMEGMAHLPQVTSRLKIGQIFAPFSPPPLAGMITARLISTLARLISSMMLPSTHPAVTLSAPCSCTVLSPAVLFQMLPCSDGILLRSCLVPSVF